jgi:hypothetical protein
MSKKGKAGQGKLQEHVEFFLTVREFFARSRPYCESAVVHRGPKVFNGICQEKMPKVVHSGLASVLTILPAHTALSDQQFSSENMMVVTFSLNMVPRNFFLFPKANIQLKR